MIIKNTIQSQTVIRCSAKELWDFLVNPKKIEKYMFGTKVTSEWEKGSKIRFEGKYEGKTYLDKGIIQAILPEKKLEYTYLSSLSGLQDNPENYSLITFDINLIKEQTVLTIHQQGFVSNESIEHSKANWEITLKNIKQLAESH